jgi:hypothetical protein
MSATISYNANHTEWFLTSGYTVTGMGKGLGDVLLAHNGTPVLKFKSFTPIILIEGAAKVHAATPSFFQTLQRLLRTPNISAGGLVSLEKELEQLLTCLTEENRRTVNKIFGLSVTKIRVPSSAKKLRKRATYALRRDATYLLKL